MQRKKILNERGITGKMKVISCRWTDSKTEKDKRIKKEREGRSEREEEREKESNVEKDFI